MKARLVSSCFIAALLAAGLSGCASTEKTATDAGAGAAAPAASTAKSRTSPGGTARPRPKSLAPRADNSENDPPADPLLDSPYQTLAACDADDAFGAGDKFGDVRLVCPTLKVSATITEFRDAGWRIEELRMTEVKTPEGEVAMPFSVTLRKLF